MTSNLKNKGKYLRL